MGSLMAGWASPVQDERKVQARRNRSLTKEEIEAFRRSQKKGEFGGYCDEEAVGVVESAGEDEATVYAAESSASHSQVAGNPACCMQWALFSARPVCRIPQGGAGTGDDRIQTRQDRRLVDEEQLGFSE
ncbi:uncharacterized protein LOC109705819 isoform X3 [Ananas comosus]|uniref:Uncharacterized protein LOC109705819 isoform X3 n=1 Tax=Ananas comosus TaxID=4615 RepID=A0A6P5EFY9_ANACO|nr:uncharacterized protein LOC109705819 isoform X3 [Ananas comosus]